MQAFSYQVPSGVAKLPAEIKFRFSLKATKNLPIGLTLLRKRQTKCVFFFKFCGLTTVSELFSFNLSVSFFMFPCIKGYLDVPYLDNILMILVRTFISYDIAAKRYLSWAGFTALSVQLSSNTEHLFPLLRFSIRSVSLLHFFQICSQFNRCQILQPLTASEKLDAAAAAAACGARRTEGQSNQECKETSESNV